MKDKGWQPKHWEIFHRLQSAGCPVDLENLPEPWCFLSVYPAKRDLPTHIFPLRKDTAFVLPLTVRSSRRITIVDLSLRADWLPQPVSWIASCDLGHTRCAAFHECQYGTINLSEYPKLELLFEPLRPGLPRTVLLRGVFPGSLPANAPAELSATLYLRDADGDYHRFGVQIKNVVPSEEALAPYRVSKMKHKPVSPPNNSPVATRPTQSVAEKIFNPVLAQYDAREREKAEAEQRAKTNQLKRENKNRPEPEAENPQSATSGQGNNGNGRQ